jgi:hypothetical protein
MRIPASLPDKKSPTPHTGKRRAGWSVTTLPSHRLPFLSKDFYMSFLCLPIALQQWVNNIKFFGVDNTLRTFPVMAGKSEFTDDAYFVNFSVDAKELDCFDFADMIAECPAQYRINGDWVQQYGDAFVVVFHFCAAA